MVNGSGQAVRLDSVGVEFDDERLVANAGIMLTATLAQRLGLGRLVDETVDLGERPGAAQPGRKVLSLVCAMALGADSIDDCDILRAGGTEALLGHRAMAASTLGTFLRSFTFGHVRQLDRVIRWLSCLVPRTTGTKPPRAHVKSGCLQPKRDSALAPTVGTKCRRSLRLSESSAQTTAPTARRR